MEGYREDAEENADSYEKALRKTRDKVKVKFTLETATKAQRGSRGLALLFL